MLDLILPAIITAIASIIGGYLSYSSWRRTFLDDAKAISNVKEALGEDDELTAKIVKLLRKDMENVEKTRSDRDTPKSISFFILFFSGSIALIGIILLDGGKYIMQLLNNLIRPLAGWMLLMFGCIGFICAIIGLGIVVGEQVWTMILRPIIKIVIRKRNKNKQSKNHSHNNQ